MKHSLGEIEGGLAVNFPLVHSRNFPRQSSPQDQAESPHLGHGPYLFSQEPSQSMGILGLLLCLVVAIYCE
jgi:hypothetical protein